MDKLSFTNTNDRTETEFYVIADTRINSRNYLLVADSKEEDAVALILKDCSNDGDVESTYVIVDDDTELKVVSEIFSEILEDYDIE